MFSTRLELQLYITSRGEVPFALWLESLRDVRMKQVLEARLIRIADGNLGDCKSVGGGVYELRIFYGPGLRVYFGRRGEQLIILLLGGDKKTQQKDIKKAQDFWRDYKGRSAK